MNDKFNEQAFFVEAVRTAIRDGESVTLAGTGNSMRPFIDPDTDRLTLSPLPETVKPGHVCLYVRADGHPVIHRVWRVHRDGSCDTVGDAQIRIERRVPQKQLVAVLTDRIRGDDVLHCTDPAVLRKAARHMRWRVCTLTVKCMAEVTYDEIKAIIRKAIRD